MPADVCKRLRVFTRPVLAACAAALALVGSPLPRGGAALALTRVLQTRFAPLRADGNGVAALERRVSVQLVDVALERALQAVAEQASLGLTYSRELPDLNKRVTLRVRQRSAAVALSELLRDSALELLVSESGQTVLVRRAGSASGGQGIGSLSGTIRQAGDSSPVGGARVELIGTQFVATSSDDGRFSMPQVAAGSYEVRATRLGYRPSFLVGVGIGDGTNTELTILLDRAVTALAQVVVTPGYFGVMEQSLAAPQSLSRDKIETAPQLGDDLFRAVNRLPGVASTDLSASFRVRGGTNDQLFVMLDGLELIEPYHLKDFDGALSIVDAGAVGGVDLTTGGFGAQFGNRLVGVFDMRSAEVAPGPPRTTLGLSLTNVRVMSQGAFGPDDRGRWLFSVRRGYLDLALRLARSDDDLDPTYYDLFGKVEYKLRPSHTLSARVLHASDRLVYLDDPADPVLRSSYKSSYGWVTSSLSIGDALRVRSVLSAGRLSWHRGASRLSGSDNLRDLFLRDDRENSFLGLRQDWSWDWSSRALLTWGIDAKATTMRYDYRNLQERVSFENGVPVVHPDSTRVLMSPDGTMSGAYVAQRVRPWDALVAEVGVRYDRQSYSDDEEVGPRANVSFSPLAGTTLRAAWGRYSQAHGIHQLQVQDGAREFYPPEIAEHRVVGVDQRLPFGATVRLEGYRRLLRRPRPRYFSISQNLDVFPEFFSDRFLNTPTSGDARGVELYIFRDAAARVDWSASYAVAVAEDRIDGRDVPRSHDQRHTIAWDVVLRPSPKWRLGAAWQYHTGWPFTLATFSADTLANGNIVIERSYGPQNGDRLAPYHRLDARVTRRFDTKRGHVAVFLDVFNVYGRRNPREMEYDVTLSRNRLTVRRVADELLPFLPSFGISWEF